MHTVSDSGLNPGKGHCIVFLHKTYPSFCLSPPKCINGCLHAGRVGGGEGKPAID